VTGQPERRRGGSVHPSARPRTKTPWNLGIMKNLSTTKRGDNFHQARERTHGGSSVRPCSDHQHLALYLGVSSILGTKGREWVGVRQRQRNLLHPSPEEFDGEASSTRCQKRLIYVKKKRWVAREHAGHWCHDGTTSGVHDVYINAGTDRTCRVKVWPSC